MADTADPRVAAMRKVRVKHGAHQCLPDETYDTCPHTLDEIESEALEAADRAAGWEQTSVMICRKHPTTHVMYPGSPAVTGTSASACDWHQAWIRRAYTTEPDDGR